MIRLTFFIFKMKYFKRKLERKVRTEHKRARLEMISLILHKSFVDLLEVHRFSSDDESRNGDNTTQETEIQEDCIAAVSSNLNVLCRQDNKEYKDAESINDDGYDDNFNESSHSSDDVDVSDQ